MLRIWSDCPWDVTFLILSKSMTMDRRLAWRISPGKLRVSEKLSCSLMALCNKHSAAYARSLQQPTVEINLQGPQNKYTKYAIMLAYERFPVTMWHWGNPPRKIVDIHTAEDCWGIF